MRAGILPTPNEFTDSLLDDLNRDKKLDKILVTGSLGFIGSHLIHSLAQCGAAILGIDKDSPKSNQPGDFEQCDIRDEKGLINIFSAFNPTCVIHLAATTMVSPGATLQDFNSNTTGVLNLIRAIEATASVKRSIFTSSQAVCRLGYVPTSDTKFCPITTYGESKVITEQLVREHNGGGVDWCVVRPTTVWGPGMSAHYCKFFRMLQNGTYFHIDSKDSFKSFGFVGNVVHQYLKLIDANSETINEKVFYLGDYSPISLRDWTTELNTALGGRRIRSCPKAVAHAFALLGDAVNVMGFPNYPFNSFRLANILTNYEFDLTATRGVCGPLPYTSLEAIDLTVNWIRTLHGEPSS